MIKALLVVIATTFLLSCKDTKTKQSENTSDSINNSGAVSGESASVLNDFAAFKDAVMGKDKQKVKSFFKFPVTGDNNQIWFYVAKTDADRDAIPTETKAFTEADFDKHYDTLFSEQFTTALSKINVQDLSTKGEAETGNIPYSDGLYKMTAYHDKNAKTIELLLSITSNDKDEKGNSLGTHTEKVQYTFTVSESGKLMFKQLTTPNAA
jgi:hypothetical protein